jgi:hypothetical protein
MLDALYRVYCEFVSVKERGRKAEEDNGEYGVLTPVLGG